MFAERKGVKRVDFTLPQAVCYILRKLNDAGYEAYTVGGCVRDLLRGVMPQDWDITTSALPEQTKACFAGHRIIETGMQHGTVALLIDKEIYEVTTYRIDGDYLDSRHPTRVEFVQNIELDLARRDFTVNAMGYHPQLGLVDPFSGQEDLAAGIIRCVGDATARFEEDALRIMRAIRFASVLRFSIHPDTAAAIHAGKHNLNRIAKERIRVELLKLLCGEHVKGVLCSYRDVFETVIPTLAECDVAWEKIAAAVALAEQDEVLRLSILLAQSKAHAKDELTRLRFDRKTVDTVSKLVEHLDDGICTDEIAIKKQLAKLGAEDFLRLMQIKKAMMQANGQDHTHTEQVMLTAKRLVLENACLSVGALAVTGSDLLSIGIEQGREIGNTLNMLLTAVMEEQVENEKSALLAFVMSKSRS